MGSCCYPGTAIFLRRSIVYPRAHSDRDWTSPRCRHSAHKQTRPRNQARKSTHRGKESESGKSGEVNWKQRRERRRGEVEKKPKSNEKEGGQERRVGRLALGQNASIPARGASSRRAVPGVSPAPVSVSHHGSSSVSPMPPLPPPRLRTARGAGRGRRCLGPGCAAADFTSYRAALWKRSTPLNACRGIFYPFLFSFFFLVEETDVREGRKELKLLPLASQHSLNGFNPVSSCKIPTFLVEVIHVIFSEEQIGACRRCTLPWNECCRRFGAGAGRAGAPILHLCPQEPPRSQPGTSRASRASGAGSVQTAISRKAVLLLRG